MRVIMIQSRAVNPSILKLAKAVSLKGWDVTLLLWDRDGRSGIEIPDGCTVKKFGLRAPQDRISVLLYLPAWWLFVLVYLLRDNSTVVHAADLDTLIPALIARPVKRFRLFYIIYDFYAHNIPAFVPRPLVGLVAGLEKFGIGRSDVLFLVDESRLEQVKGAKIKKLVYLYNTPPDHPDVRDESPSYGNDIRLFYAGILHETRGIQHTIQAIAGLDNVRLRIAGNGPYEGRIKREARGTGKVEYVGYLPYETVLKEERAADVLFAFYDPLLPNNRYASPNKLFEAMMCGKPIIVNSETSAARIVERCECGLCVPYGDVRGIRKAILELAGDPSLKDRLGRNGRTAYEREYSWAVMENRLTAAYDCYRTTG